VRQSLRSHLTYANVISTLCLFLLLGGGTAVALSGSNTVFSDDIVDNQVYSADVRNDDLAGGGLTGVDIDGETLTATDLAPDSVLASEIKSGAVASDEVLNQGLTAADLAPSSVNTEEIATEAVGTSEVINKSLTLGDLGNDSVDKVQIRADAVGALEIGDNIVANQSTPVTIGGGAAQNGAYNTGAVSSSCTGSAELISGFGAWTDNVVGDEVWITEVVPNASEEKVTVTGGNDSGHDRHLVAIAMCLQP
jgi:hypothetical protein